MDRGCERVPMLNATQPDLPEPAMPVAARRSSATPLPRVGSAAPIVSRIDSVRGFELFGYETFVDRGGRCAETDLCLTHRVYLSGRRT